MTKETQQALDGPTKTSAPTVELLAQARSDHELRRLAVAHLAEHLEIGPSLIERCETLAFAQRGDRLGPSMPLLD